VNKLVAINARTVELHSESDHMTVLGIELNPDHALVMDGVTLLVLVVASVGWLIIRENSRRRNLTPGERASEDEACDDELSIPAFPG
jgi:hypothetical protein